MVFNTYPQVDNVKNIKDFGVPNPKWDNIFSKDLPTGLFYMEEETERT